MSVLTDYREIRNKLGEEMFSRIEKFLECHSQYLLSDVYYNEKVWKEFKDWEKKYEKKIPITRNELIDTMNSILKNHFKYVPLYTAINVADELIKKGVVDIK